MQLSQSFLVGAAGQAMFKVGGAHARTTHKMRGYIISLEWDEDDGEPMMMIWSETGGLDAGVFGIGRSSIGKYVEADGRPAAEGLFECAKALPVLGRAQLTTELHALVDVVLNFTPALIRMPPCPRLLRQKAKGQALIDITTKDQNGKTIRETSV
jgi:hypothetical protein